MAKAEVKGKIEVDLKITIELTINEARALEAITKYGAKEFLAGYYKHLGRSYLEPHEKAVQSLFETIKETLPFKLYDADQIVKTVSSLKLNR